MPKPGHRHRTGCPTGLPPPSARRQVWSTKGVEGVHRFLARVYRLVTEQPLSDEQPDKEQLRLLHQCIKKVGGRRWAAYLCVCVCVCVCGWGCHRGGGL